MRKIIFFIVLFFCVNVNAQSQLQFKQVLTAQFDTTYQISGSFAYMTADFGSISVPDSSVIKVNKIAYYKEDAPNSSPSTGCSAFNLYVLVNGKPVETEDMQGVWLESGDLISFRMNASTSNGIYNYCHQIVYVLFNAIEYKVTPY